MNNISEKKKKIFTNNIKIVTKFIFIIKFLSQKPIFFVHIKIW